MTELTEQALGGEFPDWDIFQGVDRLWHARVKGAVPPVMVHGESLMDLRDSIIVAVRKSEMLWSGQHRPEGSTL
jgi:hypothetical protein